jgi:hypothetical protein
LVHISSYLVLSILARYRCEELNQSTFFPLIS